MNSSIWCMCAVFVIIAVQSKRLDPGPQKFFEKTSRVQKNQKKYVREEIVVYLTPRQIKAIQEGKGYISDTTINQSESPKYVQKEIEQQQPEQGDTIQSNLESQVLEEEDNQVPSSTPMAVLNSEQIENEPQFTWLYIPKERKFIPSPGVSYAYLRYYPQFESQTEAVELEQEENEEEQRAQPEAPQQQRFRLVPYEEATEKSSPSTTKAPQKDPIRERWFRILEKNRSQLRKSLLVRENATTTSEKPQTKPESALARWRYSARYNGSKTIENEAERRQNVSEKQKTVIRAEARVNKVPVIIRKEIIRKNPETPLIKQVEVPTSVLIPTTERLEVLNPISVQAMKSKKTGANKPVATERTEDKIHKTTAEKKPASPTDKVSVVEQRVLANSEKEVSLEAPSSQKGHPEKITIIRHIWKK